MKKLLLLIIVIGLYSCKKKNVYKDELNEYLKSDSLYIDSEIYNMKLFIERKNDVFPEQYNLIYKKGSTVDSILSSFNKKIHDAKSFKSIDKIITDELKHLKQEIPKPAHGVLENLENLNSKSKIDEIFYKKIINHNILKTKFNIYKALSSGRTTGCWGGGRKTSVIKTSRKNDSIVSLVLSSAFIKNAPELFEEGFFKITQIKNYKNEELKTLTENKIFDVYSLDILSKSDDNLKLKIDLFTSKNNQYQVFETFNGEIKIGEQKPFTLLDTIYK